MMEHGGRQQATEQGQPQSDSMMQHPIAMAGTHPGSFDAAAFTQAQQQMYSGHRGIPYPPQMALNLPQHAQAFDPHHNAAHALAQF